MKIYQLSEESQKPDVDVDVDVDIEDEEKLEVKPFNERMEIKKIKEQALWERIYVKIPWEIEIASTSQDMRGIDAFVVGLKNGPSMAPKTVQLKERHSVGDVALELVKPFKLDKNGRFEDHGLTGKDMITTVDLYFCVDSASTLRIYNGTKLKTSAVTMGESFIRLLKYNPRKTRETYPDGAVAVIQDPSPEATGNSGSVEKIMAYINPDIVTPIYTLQLD